MEGAHDKINNDQLEFMADIKSSAAHQLEMVNCLLDISNIESGQLTLNIKKFSLNSIITQIKAHLKPDCSEKSLTFEVKGLEEGTFMLADPIKFKEILLQLLNNAIKFTIKGGITLIIKEEKKDWVFKVVDTGIGIAEQDYKIIFEVFKREESDLVDSFPGSGLGLPIVKRLINLHGGYITFTTEYEKGTTFTFTIPKTLDSS